MWPKLELTVLEKLDLLCSMVTELKADMKKIQCTQQGHGVVVDKMRTELDLAKEQDLQR